MEKRGISNIEMVLAFLIFIGVVLFVIYFFSGQFSQKAKSESIDYIQNIILDKSKEKLKTYSVKINKEDMPNTQQIVAIKLNLNLDFDENVVAYDLSDKNIPVRISGEIIYLNITGSSKIINIGVSKSIINNYVSFSDAPDENGAYYEIASIKSDKILSEKKLEELKRAYTLDYNKLRSELGVGRGLDFGFLVGVSESDVLESIKEVPSNVQLFTKSTREQILKKDGRIVFADFKVSVW